MAWLGNHFGSSDDFNLYIKTLKDHNYFAWNIHFESGMKSVNNQIMNLNQQIQKINTMSLTSKAHMSPYQGLANQYRASNDWTGIGMSQHMDRILNSHQTGIKKNAKEVDKILKTLKDTEERKRKLIEYDGKLKQSQEEWEALQAKKSHNSSHNLSINTQNKPNVNDDMQQKLKDMQDKVNQMENMMMNVQAHILNDDDNKNNQMNDNVKELSDWLQDIGLPQYLDVFVKNGFEDLESLEDVTMDDLKEIKITKLGHRKLLLKEIQKSKK